ncbi:hypothetical protein BU23DRAFT_589548 [Bimuria novae-zelandiae CBS 107.79]|uniref:Uncharacterized protein n=1 Tax=Bimuria novae-zelandiae CBS 107.79 TaxID=1447943 RepID=A0A6A5VJR7_9PLEO|nr:hypothetical protein BU23DRAFT_589548 [Bimuria novae-zelandiae CBS 107.79]
MKDQAGKSAVAATGDGEVSSRVTNLIHAFTDGLNVFKRLRERRRRKKTKQREKEREEASGAELLLSESLRKGPVELRERYESCYGEKGEKFAKGDAIAHASLAETLIRFNTGLVRIIATFLHRDSKNCDLKLDYKSLTSLSDISRREAIDSMNQLYQRLGRSQLQLHRRSDIKNEPEKKKRSSSRQRSHGPTVTRVSVKSSGNSTQTQLAMVRPRNARKGSSSSSSSSWSRTQSSSTTTSSPWATPPRSPLPEYSPKDPFPPQNAPAVAKAPNKLLLPLDGARPTTWPQPRATKPHPFKGFLPTPEEYFAMEASGTQLPPDFPRPFGNATDMPPRRRADKPTPSTYTFASDSTKLGEIPTRKWSVPFDYEEAARKNAEVEVRGWPVAVAPVEGKVKRGKGLRSLFKKAA